MHQKISYCFFIVFFVVLCVFCGAQSINEAEEAKKKAAFIYGFTRYVFWENQDKFPVFAIGVLGNEPHLVNALDDIADKKKAGIPPNQKSIVVKTFKNIQEVSGVQMLYVHKRSGFDIEKILEKIKGMRTLLISENYPYKTSMINMIQFGNFQKFEYDKRKILAENMKISSEVDEFAISSYEDWRDLAKMQETELKKEKETVEKQSEQLSAQEKEIAEKEKELREKKLEIEEKNREIESRKKEIEKQKSEVLKLKNETQKLLQNLKFNREKFESQKIEMLRQNAEIEKQEKNLKKLKREAEILEKQNREKEQTISEKEAAISEKESEIEKQRIYILFAAVIVLLVSGFGFYIFKQYRAKQRINKILEERRIAIQRQKEEIEKQKKLVDDKNRNITASINYAKRIQQAILISREQLEKIMPEYFIFYRPRDIVSGDFYWAHLSDSGKLIIAAVDCTGHGVPGAFMSMVGNALLNEIVIENKVEESDEILNELKKGVISALKQTDASEQKDGMDIALCSADFQSAKPGTDFKSVLQFSGAYNPLYHFRNGILTEYKGDRQTIGYQKGKENTPFTKHLIEIQKGDTIYIFTDGFADQKGGKDGRKFYYKPLQDLLASVQHLPMAEQRNAIKKTFVEWKGNYEQVDDVCVIGMRV